MDSTVAADIVDELFLTVRNSIWLPQHGFESWSLFYLQRKGMSLDQLKTFLRDFNDAIKFKLRNPDSQAVDPRLLRALNRSSRFNELDARAESGFDSAACVEG